MEVSRCLPTLWVAWNLPSTVGSQEVTPCICPTAQAGCPLSHPSWWGSYAHLALGTPGRGVHWSPRAEASLHSASQGPRARPCGASSFPSLEPTAVSSSSSCWNHQGSPVSQRETRQEPLFPTPNAASSPVVQSRGTGCRCWVASGPHVPISTPPQSLELAPKERASRQRVALEAVNPALDSPQPKGLSFPCTWALAWPHSSRCRFSYLLVFACGH